MIPPPEIHDRGRGPEIKGTRITVYDVLAHHRMGWSPHRIALFFRIGSDQVECALKYIAEHKEDVLREDAKIRARHAKGNPPELQFKLDAAHEKFMKWKAELDAKRRKEANGRPSD